MEIKKEIQKNSLIYYLLIATFVLTVFVDLFNGFIKQYLGIGFSVGAFYRILLIVLLIPFLFKAKNKFFNSYFYSLLFVWLSSHLFWLSNYINYQTFYSFRFEFETMLKSLLVYFILAFLLALNQKYKFDIRKVLNYAITWSTIASSAVVFSAITGLGLKSYEQGSTFGTKSFFIAINDISLTILVTFPFVIYFFLEKTSKIGLIKILLHIIALFLIASRAGSVGGIGVLIVYSLALLFYKRISIKAKATLFIGVVITLSITIYSLVLLVLSDNYLLEKMYALTQEKPRGKMEDVARSRITNRDELQQVFGEGFYSYSREIEARYYQQSTTEYENQFAEVDTIDSIGSGGYILGILILFFPFIIYLKSIYIFLINKNMLNFTFLMAISLYLIHFSLAGHALLNTYIQGLLAIIYFYILQKYRDENKTNISKN